MSFHTMYTYSILSTLHLKASFADYIIMLAKGTNHELVFYTKILLLFDTLTVFIS